MNQVIRGLKINPQNYFHEVVNDIIGIINLYLVPPTFQDLIDDIIRYHITPCLPGKYLRMDTITYDLAYHFYKYHGIGPNEWVGSENCAYGFAAEWLISEPSEYYFVQLISDYIQNKI